MSTTYHATPPVTIAQVLEKLPEGWTATREYPFRENGQTRLLRDERGASVWMHVRFDERRLIGEKRLEGDDLPAEFEAFGGQYARCEEVLQVLADIHRVILHDEWDEVKPR